MSPDNTHLPVLCYRGAVRDRGRRRLKPAFEQRLADHGWPQWQGSVFTYHHDPSIALEAPRVFVTRPLRSPGGKKVDVKARDALILPVGTNHCRIAGNQDFEVVDAWLRERKWDICTATPSAETRAPMKALPLPHRDPVTGRPGSFEAVRGD